MNQFSSLSWTRRLVVASLILAEASLLATATWAQVPRTRSREAPEKVAPPEVVQLSTKDGVKLACKYFAGPKSEATIPVLLVHALGEEANDWDRLAAQLQQAGKSVLAVNLRGHGSSTQRVSFRGEVDTIDSTKLRKPDWEAMINEDLEAAKRFLKEKNNAGELNINQLVVIGCESGGLVAALWTALDWSWPPIAGAKQGQDVKAVVLISPESAVKGLSVRTAFVQPAFKEVYTAFVYGDEGKAGTNVERMYRALERQQDKDAPNILKFSPSTSLQGMKLLQEPAVARAIVQFIDDYVGKNAERFPYSKRDSIAAS